MKNRFYALRFLSVFYRVLGWVIIGLSVILGLFFILGQEPLLYDGVYYFMPEMENVRSLGAIILVIGLLIGMGVVALGETMKVALELEKNTRASSLILERLVTLQESSEVASSSDSAPRAFEGNGSDAPAAEN